jgi:hypothetical protein
MTRSGNDTDSPGIETRTILAADRIEGVDFLALFCDDLPPATLQRARAVLATAARLFQGKAAVNDVVALRRELIGVRQKLVAAIRQNGELEQEARNSERVEHRVAVEHQQACERLEAQIANQAATIREQYEELRSARLSLSACGLI